LYQLAEESSNPKKGKMKRIVKYDARHIQDKNKISIIKKKCLDDQKFLKVIKKYKKHPVYTNK